MDPSATATNPLLITEKRLYPPEIINNWEEIDMFKSDIYVLGWLIIECGWLVDLSLEEEPDLSYYLEKFTDQYSEDLCKLLESMLEIEPDNRPTFGSLKEYLVEEM